jgi:TrmH family RNA methyltransferase
LLSRKQVKHIHSLRQKKFREIHRQFLAEGSKLVTEILESQYKVVTVYALADWLNRNENILHSKNIPFTEISKGEMDRITALSSPSPVLVIAEIPATPIIPATAIHDIILVLDDIKDQDRRLVWNRIDHLL